MTDFMALRRPECFEGRVLSVYTKPPYKDRETQEVTSPEADICQLLVQGYTGVGDYEAKIYGIVEFKLRNGHTLPQYQKLIDKNITVELGRSAYVDSSGRPADSYSTINGLFPTVVTSQDSAKSATSTSSSYLKAAS